MMSLRTYHTNVIAVINIYLGRYIYPNWRITIGQQNTDSVDKRKNLATYFYAMAMKICLGALFLSGFPKSRHNTKRFDSVVQPPNSRGELRPVRDALPARNTIINTTWMKDGLKPGLKLKNIFRWQTYYQIASALICVI